MTTQQTEIEVTHTQGPAGNMISLSVLQEIKQTTSRPELALEILQRIPAENSGGPSQALTHTCSPQTTFSSRSHIYNCVIVRGTDRPWLLLLIYIQDLKFSTFPAMFTYHFVFWFCHRNLHFFSTWIITGRARSEIHHLFLLFLEAVCYSLNGFRPFFPGKI